MRKQKLSPKSISWTGRVIVGLLAVILVSISLSSTGVAAYGDTGALVVDKTLTLDSDGQYWLEMSAYATGQDIVKYLPMDIILVLDQSSSMREVFDFTLPDTPTLVITNESGRTLNTIRNTINNGGSIFYPIPKDGTAYSAEKECDYYLVQYTPVSGNIRLWTRDKMGHQILIQEGAPGDTYNLEIPLNLYSNCPKTTRLAALKSASMEFLDMLVDKKNAGADYRVGIVGFASDPINGPIAGTEEEIANTEILSLQNPVSMFDAGSDGTQSSALYKASAKIALQNLGSNYAILEDAIDTHLSAGGATAVDRGLEMAADILEARSSREKLERGALVVVFSDGEPAISVYDENTANRGLGQANRLKNISSATIYSVGIFPQAATGGNNIEDSFYDSPATIPGKLALNLQWANNFMHIISSNFGKDRTLINDTKSYHSIIVPDIEGNHSNEYFLGADDVSGLKSAFTLIGNSSTQVELGTESMMKDIISDKFELPAGISEEDIEIWISDAQSYDNSTGKVIFRSPVQTTDYSVEVLAGEKAVTVTGFDYSDRYISAKRIQDRDDGLPDVDPIYCQKLIMRIPVNALTAGEGMDSNAVGSGIYAATEDGYFLYQSFTSPKANIKTMYVVLDFARPIMANVGQNLDYEGKNYELININSTDPTLALNGDSGPSICEGHYGVFQINPKADSVEEPNPSRTVVTYTPTTTNWDGYDTVFAFGTIQDGANKTWDSLCFVPANNVYYEDDFLHESTIVGGYSRIGIEYTGNWDVVADSTKPIQESSDYMQLSSDEFEPYGKDFIYRNDPYYSSGSTHLATGTNASASFTFTGTGFDVYSRTDSKVVDVVAVISKISETGEAVQYRAIIMNNKSMSGTYYQIPTIGIEVPYGTYKVELYPVYVGTVKTEGDPDFDF